MKTLVIDPGHGGSDLGATNGTRLEKNDNLRLGLAIRDKLSGIPDLNIIMTRDSDVFLTLAERSEISNASNADMFVSLHRNSSINPAFNGVENFINTSPTLESLLYAVFVLNEILSVGVQSDHGIGFEDFAVLRQTNAPAQLLEMGFITNEIDNIYFDRYLDSYASAIAQGILRSLELSTEAITPRAEIIKSIQAILNSRYETNLVVDGLYGPSTRRALITGLQTELNRLYGAGLVVDGVFGPATRAAIRNVRSGESGNIVYLLQAALFAHGFEPGPLDGNFSRITGEALREFQFSRGLAPDGIAGPATFAALLGS